MHRISVEFVMMKIKNRRFAFVGLAIVALLVGVFAWRSYGQFGRSKYTSPPASVAATIAGNPINIEYYAPSMHGRKVMGGLVPFGAVWCTGANWATKITTQANLEMGGLKLPAGSYSIWTLPNQNEWALIINKQTGQFHLNYDSSQDFGRTKMNLKTLAGPMEAARERWRCCGRQRKRQSHLQWSREATLQTTLRRQESDKAPIQDA